MKHNETKWAWYLAREMFVSCVCVFFDFYKIQAERSKSLWHATEIYLYADFRLAREKDLSSDNKKFEAHSKYRLSVEIDCIPMWYNSIRVSHFVSFFVDLWAYSDSIYACVCVYFVYYGCFYKILNKWPVFFRVCVWHECIYRSRWFH